MYAFVMVYAQIKSSDHRHVLILFLPQLTNNVSEKLAICELNNWVRRLGITHMTMEGTFFASMIDR